MGKDNNNVFKIILWIVVIGVLIGGTLAIINKDTPIISTETEWESARDFEKTLIEEFREARERERIWCEANPILCDKL